MSGAPRVRSLNVDDNTESRPIFMPGGNKAVSMAIASKPASKTSKKIQCKSVAGADKKTYNPSSDAPQSTTPKSPPSLLRRHEFLFRSNLSMNASCSSDASTDSFCSRASTGRIGRASFTSKRKYIVPKDKVAAKVERSASDGEMVPPSEVLPGKRKCAWVTPNTEPCYAAFHDEEWGVPVHDDKKLFEVLVLSGALAELTWPVILSKRNLFREVFFEFDPSAVSKMNEKKIAAPGSPASSLLSEPKLRAIIENARQILKIIDEFGSLDRYCWSFLNYKPIFSRFRYPRQIPPKTAKAEFISKDLVRRGFRSVSPTVIYSFMQAAGMTNDHLTSCYRFEECVSLASAPSKDNESKGILSQKMEEKINVTSQEFAADIDLELSKAIDELSLT